MKKNSLFSWIIAITMILCSGNVFAQAGYIIRVDGDKVYLNLPNAKALDIVSVFDNGGYVTDPRTGRKIRLNPEEVGQIKIIAVHGAYAVGKIYGNTTMSLAESMTVQKKTTVLQRDDYGEVTVMIAPADLNFPKGLNNLVSNGGGNEYVSEGYIGDYVSAALMPHLLKSGKIQLIDHSLLTPQQNNYGETYSNPAVNYAKEMGARYMVKVTMLKPDVDAKKERVNMTPKKIFEGVSRLTNVPSSNATNTLKEVLPENMAISNMQVSVKMLVHLVDLQTGRVLDIWDAEGKASGKATVDLRSMSAFGDLFVGGADFTQTVTGKAIDKAFEKIGKELNKYLKENL